MQPDQIEEQKKKIQESEHNARKKEIELQFKNVFDEAKLILRKGYPENEIGQKLNSLLEWIESDINKLQEKTDREFFKKYKSFVETYRSGLIEFKEILLILKKIQENFQELKKVKINSYQQNHGSLLTEIKFSEKRLQRMRAGVHLVQVLEESLKQKFNKIQTLQQEDYKESEKSQQQLELSDSEIQIFEELEKGFQKQKIKVETIVKSSYKPEGGDMDFTKKYSKQYFKNYFKERFKLANYFLGDELIKRFLYENQEYVNKKLNQNSHSSQQNSMIEKKIYNKELDPKNFIQQEDLESNGRALQKILKINEEIQKELLQDEHQRNLQEMNKIEIQKKQEHWDKVLQQDEHRKSTPNLRRKSQQIQLKKSQTVEKKTINIKPVISSLKKRTIYYQAHPNFPLISEVYKSHQNVPEERLKKAAIGYDIVQQPMRPLFTPSTMLTQQENKKILKMEDDIYPQQPPIRTPQTAMQNFRGTFFPHSQPGLSRQNYSDFKSLTTLWGEHWNNY